MIVDILRRRYIELERMAVSSGVEKERIKLSMDVKVERGLAPATGFAESAEEIAADVSADAPVDPLSSIAAATQEAQMLYELTQDLGNSLSLQEALAFVGVRMKRLIPYETIAVYIRRDEKLIPEYVSGENLRLFTSLEIPVGQGLSGWVAENNKPLLNGNPSVEAGYLNDPDQIQHAALGAGGAAQRRQRTARRDGALPGGARCLQQGEPADSARDQSQGGAGDRERADAPAARNVHHDRLSDESPERALALPVAR